MATKRRGQENQRMRGAFAPRAALPLADGGTLELTTVHGGGAHNIATTLIHGLQPFELDE